MTAIEARTAQRNECLNAAGKGGEFPPYSADEQRAWRYLMSLADIGCGADPIGFLIASHGYQEEALAEREWEIERLREALEGLLALGEVAKYHGQAGCFCTGCQRVKRARAALSPTGSSASQGTGETG